MAHLQKSDLIGIVSPSAPISAFCPRRLERGVEFLKNQGFEVLLGSSVRALTNFTAGTAEERATDINEMFADKDVRAIVATIGGYNANDVLPLLDYELIKQNNDKLFIGYSDVTVLIHALYKKAGVRGVMGPMVLPQFAEYPEMQPFSLGSFKYVTENLGKKIKYNLPVSNKYTEEMLLWDNEDDKPRKMENNHGWDIIVSGEAQGILVPANLNTLCNLVGTPFMQNFKNAIYFIEDDSDENASTIQRMLQHMKQAGFLDELKGIVFGRFEAKSEMNFDITKRIIDNIFDNVGFPVISNVDFGHTDPMISLPIGNDVRINTDKNEIQIIL